MMSGYITGVSQRDSNLCLADYRPSSDQLGSTAGLLAMDLVAVGAEWPAVSASDHASPQVGKTVSAPLHVRVRLLITLVGASSPA